MGAILTEFHPGVTLGPQANLLYLRELVSSVVKGNLPWFECLFLSNPKVIMPVVLGGRNLGRD